jgi:predicted PurR-regulated permease PerM
MLTIGAVVATLLLLAGAWLARTALIIVYISALLAIGLSPVVALIERSLRVGRRRAPRWLAIGSVYLAALIIAGVFAALVVPPLIEQTSALQQKLPQMFRQAQQFLVERGLLRQPVTIEQAVTASAAPEGGGPPPLVALLGTAISGAVGGTFGLVTMLFLTFYLVLEGPALVGRLWDWIPARRRPAFREMSELIVSRVSAWLGVNVLLAAIMGVVSAAGLGLIGMPYFYVLALIAALGETVPVAGSIVAGIIAVAVATTVSIKLAIIVGVFFFVVHEIEANVLVPKLMQRRLGVTSAALIVALLIGWEWLGVMGIVLALPTTAVLAAVFEAISARSVSSGSGGATASGFYPKDDGNY